MVTGSRVSSIRVVEYYSSSLLLELYSSTRGSPNYVTVSQHSAVIYYLYNNISSISCYLTFSDFTSAEIYCL